MKKSYDTPITLETFIEDFSNIYTALNDEVIKTEKELLELNKRGKKTEDLKIFGHILERVL